MKRLGMIDNGCKFNIFSQILPKIASLYIYSKNKEIWNETVVKTVLF